ncbi:acetylcholine receptor subunit beta-like [Crassostrea virginica]
MASLLSNYSSKIRPIKNQGGSLQMSIDLFLSSIKEVSTTEQKMITAGYLKVIWTDELLLWNSTLTGMLWMKFRQRDVWVPDIVIKNGLTAFSMMGGDFYYLYVYYNGSVYWYPYMVFETSCDLDVTYFPFDTQTCSVIIISWSYSRWEVNFTIDAGEKMGYSVTIFLAYAVFLSIVSDELPMNSDSTSILSIYLMTESSMSAMSLLISSVQLRLNHRKPVQVVVTTVLFSYAASN